MKCRLTSGHAPNTVLASRKLLVFQHWGFFGSSVPRNSAAAGGAVVSHRFGLSSWAFELAALESHQRGLEDT